MYSLSIFISGRKCSFVIWDEMPIDAFPEMIDAIMRFIQMLIVIIYTSYHLMQFREVSPTLCLDAITIFFDRHLEYIFVERCRMSFQKLQCIDHIEIITIFFGIVQML